jgi:putative chitinase
MLITLEVLRRFAGARADGHYLQAIVDQAPAVLPHYGLGAAADMQAFFATLALESGGFRQREENLNYSAKRLCQVWPKRFPSLAAAAPYANNPRALADKVYGGRMGNRAAGDGYKYRGRGPGQITGHDGYAALGKVVGLPLTAQPELVASDQYLLECAAAFWKMKGLNRAVAKGPKAVRQAWNGGLIGYSDFQAWLGRAQRVFTEPLTSLAPASLLADPAAADHDEAPPRDYQGPGDSDEAANDDDQAGAIAAPPPPPPPDRDYPMNGGADELDGPVKSIGKSKIAQAAAVAGGLGGVETLSAVNDAAGQVAQLKGAAKEVGLFDVIAHALTTPRFWIAVVIVALFLGIIYWRWRDHGHGRLVTLTGKVRE